MSSFGLMRVDVRRYELVRVVTLDLSRPEECTVTPFSATEFSVGGPAIVTARMRALDAPERGR